MTAVVRCSSIRSYGNGKIIMESDYEDDEKEVEECADKDDRYLQKRASTEITVFIQFGMKDSLT